MILKMDEQLSRARAIATIEDVEKVLGSEKYSYSELVDCIQVAKQTGAWELRHRVAERAFILATNANQTKSVEDAAIELVRSSVRLARNFDDLRPVLEQARNYIESWAPSVLSLQRIKSKQISEVNEMLLLMNDDEPSSQVRLSSRLRKFERSDLGVVVANRAVISEPRNVVALTTLAAGLADIGEMEDALKHAYAAIKIDPKSHPALVVASRIKQETGHNQDALHFAKLAFTIFVNNFSAHRLLSAASRGGDSVAFADATRAIEEYVESSPEVDPWLLTLAAQVLIETSKFAEAEVAIRELDRLQGLKGISSRISKLKRDLKVAIKKNQKSLFELVEK